MLRYNGELVKFFRGGGEREKTERNRKRGRERGEIKKKEGGRQQQGKRQRAVG